MAKIPIILRLKRESYRKIAKAQDLIIEELYKIFERAILHGGTAIWRCYNGNRFSEDIDVYITKDIDKINLFFENLNKKGFIILKKKISESSIFSNLQLDNTITRFEAVFKKTKSMLKEYETADGNLITIRTLTPEDMIKEKIEAYLKRAKIRDIYDVFFLLRYINNKNKVEKDMKKLINKFKMPYDKEKLKVLIIEGIVPNIKDMLNYIKRFV